MGCIQVQQRSVSGFSHVGNSSRCIGYRPNIQIPKKSVITAECWKNRTLRALNRMVESTVAFTWVPAVQYALSVWNTGEDQQWVRAFKINYVRRSRGFQRKPSQSGPGKRSLWKMPGMSTESLIEECDSIEFLEKTLHCCHNHGIAMLLKVFTQSYKSAYRSQPPRISLSDSMLRDITEFSQLAANALEQFYEPVDLLATVKRTRKHLELIIREVILEDAEVKEMVLTGIRVNRVREDAMLRSHYRSLSTCDLQDIDAAIKPELLQVARSESGFNASILLLQRLPTLPTLREKVQCVYDVSEGVNDAIVYILGTDVQLFLTPDDLMTLCTFLLLRAAEEDLGAHLALIRGLVPSDVISEATSYSLATLESSLDYISKELRLPSY